MRQLRVYVSHSAEDNTFCDILVSALRGAGASVWYDRHIVDTLLPAQVTTSRIRNSPVFLLVLSPAALESAWVQHEFEWAYIEYKRSLERVTQYVDGRFGPDSPTATLFQQYSVSPKMLATLAQPVQEAQLSGTWQPIRGYIQGFRCIEPSPDNPLPEQDVITRTLHAVAEAIPTGEARWNLAEAILGHYQRLPKDLPEHLPGEVHIPKTVEEVLSVMLSPLRLDEPLDTLIDQGKLSSEQQENSDGGGASPSVWCVAANVAEEQPFGPGGQEIRRGTKHFAPHAKVYCFPAQWGDGYQDIRVVGRHRASHRYVTMVIPSKRLTNWRAELVYSPHVIKELAGYWDGTHASKEIAESIAQMCRERQNTQTP